MRLLPVVPFRIGKEFFEHNKRQVNKAAIDLTAYFNETTAFVDDIVNLRVGDVIRLDHRIDEPLYVRTAHIPKFRVELGSYGSNYAVRINDISKSEVEKKPEMEFVPATA